ncbi:MAG: thioesterase family protein [Burkholderiaceae bacterium]
MTPQGDHFEVSLPADWLQGRTAYGGLSAALCLEATNRRFPGLPPLRSAQLAFIGPATGMLRVTATTLRAGKSTVFVGADLVGEDGLATRATFCFGTARAVDHDHVDLPAPDAPAPDAAIPEFFGWPDQPNFMRHFDGKLAGGARPHTPGADPRMLVWLRHRDPDAGSGTVSLLAMADALPPAAFVLFQEFKPISTMTWAIDFLAPDGQSASDGASQGTPGWWLVDCAAETAQAGYSAQRTTIWTPDGCPVLIARQNVAIFGKRA